MYHGCILSETLFSVTDIQLFTVYLRRLQDMQRFSSTILFKCPYSITDGIEHLQVK